MTLVLILAVAPSASAQRADIDVFVGYSNLQAEGLPDRNTPSGLFDTDLFRNRTTLHGFNASVTGFPTDTFGLTGDFSFDRKGRTEDVTGGEDFFHTDVYYLLGGPSVSIRNASRVEPFFRAMAGGAHTRYEASSRRASGAATLENSFEVGSTSFAAALGGGLDLRAAENFKVRLIQFDWTPVFLREKTVDVLGGAGIIQPQTLEGKRQDNFRFSFGIVF
jgi:opacity protein-like surface antigen